MKLRFILFSMSPVNSGMRPYDQGTRSQEGRKNNYFHENILLIIGLFFLITACGPSETKNSAEVQIISNDSLLNLVQYQTFQYFWNGAEPTSGMARERLHMDGLYPENDQNVVTVGGSGFGVMAILVGINRGFITRQQGFERLNHIVDYLKKADRFHGVWPHWLNGETGKVKPFSAKDDGGDLVETSFMIHGLLTVRQYFKDGNDPEQLLAAKIDTLWKEHLLNMDHLKEGIGLRGYGQRDPLREYQKEGYEMFLELVGRINSETIEKLFMVQLAKESPQLQTAKPVPQRVTLSRGESGEVSKAPTVKREGKKVGRNEPCPCGSGKKYKKCCGR